MKGVFITELAVFLKFQSFLQSLFIFETLVADSFAFGTLELDQVIL